MPRLSVFLQSLFQSLLGALILVLFSADVSAALFQFFLEPFSNRYFFGNFLADAVPLMISGLGVQLHFVQGISILEAKVRSMEEHF